MKLTFPRWTILVLLTCAVGTATPQQNPASNLSAGRPAQEWVVAGRKVGKPVEPRPGEICLLCNQPVKLGDVTYLVEGQRVPTHRGTCDAQLRQHPEQVLAQLRPRGAFLGTEGADVPKPRLSSAWFLFGLYVLVGLVFAALCAHRALHTGHNPIAWFALGLVFNAVGYLALLTRPRREVLAPAGVPAGLGKISATYLPEACPMCGAEHHPAATECLSCGAKLTPRVASEVARAGLRSN